MRNVKNIKELSDILHVLWDHCRPNNIDLISRYFDGKDYLGIEVTIKQKGENPTRHVWGWDNFDDCIHGRSSIFNICYTIDKYIRFSDAEYPPEDVHFINLLQGCSSLEEFYVKLDLENI